MTSHLMEAENYYTVENSKQIINSPISHSPTSSPERDSTSDEELGTDEKTPSLLLPESAQKKCEFPNCFLCEKGLPKFFKRLPKPSWSDVVIVLGATLVRSRPHDPQFCNSELMDLFLSHWRLFLGLTQYISDIVTSLTTREIWNKLRNSVTNCKRDGRYITWPRGKSGSNRGWSTIKQLPPDFNQNDKFVRDFNHLIKQHRFRKLKRDKTPKQLPENGNQQNTPLSTLSSKPRTLKLFGTEIIIN